MDLPEELIAGVLSHIWTDDPTSLDGLQIAFTCRTLYKTFYPMVTNRQHLLLTTAIDKMRLKLLWPWTGYPSSKTVTHEFLKSLLEGRENSAPFADDLHIVNRNVDSSLEIVLTIHSLSSYHLVGSLQSLLARGLLLVVLRKFTLRLDLDKQLVGWTPSDREALRLGKALAALRETVASQVDVQLVIDRSSSSKRYALQPGFIEHDSEPADSVFACQGSGLQSTAADGESLYRMASISSLDLKGSALHSLLYSTIDKSVANSANTLTSLRIARCRIPRTEWGVVLAQWTLPALSSLYFDDMDIPIPALTTFLYRHRTIADAILLNYARGLEVLAPASSHNSSASAYPNLSTLTATPIVLLHFLCASPMLPKLQELTVAQAPASGVVQRKSPGSVHHLTSIFELLPSLSSPHSLTLRLTSDNDFVEWLDASLQANLIAPIPEALPSESANRHACAAAKLRSITSLNLSLHAQSVSDDAESDSPHTFYNNPERIIDFIAAFPKLKSATFADTWTPVAKMWRTMGMGPSPEWEKLWKLCPSLQTMEVQSWDGFQETLLRPGMAKPSHHARRRADYRVFSRPARGMGLAPLELQMSPTEQEALAEDFFSSLVFGP